MNAGVTPLRIPLPAGGSVSGVLRAPRDPRSCFVFAHGAGAGMDHAFMADFSSALGERGIATLRFQFPFMESGSKRPDPPPLAHSAVRAAVEQAAIHLPGVPLFAGGKSFGGRMASQAQALQPMPGVRGLVFVGFPLHPAGKPGIERAAHLGQLRCPMLFLQGTRDGLADLDLVRQMTASLGPLATLHVIDGADHAFHVLARSGRKDPEVLDELATTAAGWMSGLSAGAAP